MSFKIIIGTASLSGNYGSVPKQEIIDICNNIINIINRFWYCYNFALYQ